MAASFRSRTGLAVPVLVLGATGIAAQTLLLRELLILFSGNELSLGLIIGCWIAAEAIGAYVAGARLFASAGIGLFLAMTAAFCVLLPASVAAARLFKVIAGMPLDVGLGLAHVFYAACLTLLPPGLIHGFLFTLSCDLYGRTSGLPEKAAGRVYFIETAGTMAGGLCMSFILIPYLPAFHVAAVFASLNGMAFLCALRGYPRRRAAAATSLALALVPLVLLGVSAVGYLEHASILRAWQGKDVEMYRNSVYQNIVVTRSEEQYTFFADGKPIITVPVPDIVAVEEFVHFSLLTHPRPRRVLVLGSGAGGIIREILKYPTMEHVDYVETDPALLAAVERFPTPLTRRELGDPKVRLFFTDGRLFVRTSPRRYDVVLVASHAPSTLQENRVFTAEFFSLVRGVLEERGIVALRLPGSLAYYTPELRSVNVSVVQALRNTFPHVLPIPGDINIILGSMDQPVEAASAQLLTDRLSRDGLETALITPGHLMERLAPRFREWWEGAMAGARVPVNRDFLPSAVFAQVAYENLMYTPWLRGVIDAARRFSLGTGILILVSLCCAALAWSRLRRTPALPFTLATTGFAGMVSELMLVLGFQAVYGRVFYEVALLISAFMAGMAAGSLLAAGVRCSPAKRFRALMSVEAAFSLFSLFLLLTFVQPSGINPSTARAVFLALLAVAGFLTGLEFPLATQLFQARKTVGGRVGVLYAADLVGGWVGGLLTGFLLFPVIGFAGTCILLSLLKAGSFLVLLLSPKNAVY